MPHELQRAAREFAARAGMMMQESLTRNAPVLAEAAEAAAERLSRGGRLLSFGCGHSGLVAQDVYYRAGGLMDLACLFAPEVELDLVPPEQSSLGERRADWVETRQAKGGFVAEDVLILISTSGVNIAPVEMAKRACDAGALLIAVTSPSVSAALPPRHASNLRLFELAALVLDNLAPPGDTMVEFEDGSRMGSTSTAIGALLLQTLAIAIREAASRRGLSLPTYVSGNAPGGLDENRRRRG